MNAETFIAKYIPCQEAVDWLRENNFATIEQAWKVCERGDWMLWTLQKLEYPDGRIYRLMAADFAEHVLPIWEKQYPNDDRPRKAIQAARDFAKGKITREDLNNAAAAAYAAYAAYAYAAADDAYAAYAAAYAAAVAYAAYAADDAYAERAWQANKIREYLPELPGAKP